MIRVSMINVLLKNLQTAVEVLVASHNIQTFKHLTGSSPEKKCYFQEVPDIF